jgi:hypothetical protein
MYHHIIKRDYPFPEPCEDVDGMKDQSYIPDDQISLSDPLLLTTPEPKRALRPGSSSFLKTMAPKLTIVITVSKDVPVAVGSIKLLHAVKVSMIEVKVQPDNTSPMKVPVRNV